MQPVLVSRVEQAGARVNQVAAVRGFVVVRQIREPAADALALIVVLPFLERFADAVDKRAERPSEILSVVATVRGNAHFAIGGEDALRGDRALEEDVVRVVGHLLQAERNKEVADACLRAYCTAGRES